MDKPKWSTLPLEANPEVMNEWLKMAGLRDTSALEFTDIYSLDKEMLDFIPTPVKAIIALWPEHLVRDQNDFESVDVYHCKQTLKNTCGTMALIHALHGLSSEFTDSSPLLKFYNDTRDMTSLQRAAVLEGNHQLAHIHSTLANKGSSDVPSESDEVELHYVAFIEHEGFVVELDGGKQGAKRRCKIKDGLLYDVADLIKSDYLPRMKSVELNLLALVQTADEYQ